MPDDSGNSGRGIILGAMFVGRNRELPVNYFPEDGVVMVGIRSLGKANDFREALDIVGAKKKFQLAEKFRLKGISGTG